jgi:uncharacterized RDD family membrane protein YckC
MECPFCQSQTGAYSKQCKSCGKTIPPAQYLLEESGVIERASPGTFAGTASAAVPARGFRLARLGDRFIAFVLDTTFLFGLFAIADSWVFTHWGSVEGTELRLTAASVLIALTLNATLLFLYGSLLEAVWGATLGKAMVGIKVEGTSRPRSFTACAVRNVLRIIDGLGFYLVGTIVAACSAARQRVGDVYARTVVIEESFGIGIRAAAVVIWITSLAGAGWAVPRICSINHSVRPLYLGEVIVQVGTSGTAAYLQVGGLAVNVHLTSKSPGS